MLLFPFLFNTFLLSQNVNCQNNLRNKSLINNYTQRNILKSRCLAEIERPLNPHYQNDPELKKIIDQLNEEAMKKYQQSNDTYKQLHELLEKNETKSRSRNSEQEMSKIEKELLKIYEKMSGDENHIMQKSDMYTNENHKSNDKNDKSCECINKNSTDKLSSTNKVHDNYLDNLKTGFVGGLVVCALSSALVGKYGIAAAASAAKGVLQAFINALPSISSSQLTNILNGINFFYETSIKSAFTFGGITSVEYEGAASLASSTFLPYGIAIIAIIVLTIIVIILYVWLRKRRKNSWKHECKKHLCT
ncbi:hypothetical protein PFAG_00837 [Plasmodium falciparum Santa Lucia]|uniref:Stevor n=2 Tax=Plasmodium falciparum TaxID=5833 RepID=A0A0L1I4R0_PLAFA|nr:hypothetical protein PFAG_00837 [Plasmodium falciparum Santa Lucia]KNG74651.1 stevor [Plasmodium falciparum IGH-CR14]